MDREGGRHSGQLNQGTPHLDDAKACCRDLLVPEPTLQWHLKGASQPTNPPTGNEKYAACPPPYDALVHRASKRVYSCTCVGDRQLHIFNSLSEYYSPRIKLTARAPPCSRTSSPASANTRLQQASLMLSANTLCKVLSIWKRSRRGVSKVCLGLAPMCLARQLRRQASTLSALLYWVSSLIAECALDQARLHDARPPACSACMHWSPEPRARSVCMHAEPAVCAGAARQQQAQATQGSLEYDLLQWV